MIPIQHPTNNHKFAAPEGHDQKALPCETLGVTIGRDDSGAPVMASYWMPTPEELSCLIAGSPVMLFVFGTGHPIVALGVEPLASSSVHLEQ